MTWDCDLWTWKEERCRPRWTQLRQAPWGGGIGFEVPQAGGCLKAAASGAEAPSCLLSSPMCPTCLRLLEIRLHSQKAWAHGFFGGSNATQKDLPFLIPSPCTRLGGHTVREGVGGPWKLRTKVASRPAAWLTEAAGAPGRGLSLWESVSNMRLILFSPVAINWEKYFKAV